MENSQAADLTRVVFRKDSPRTDPQKEPIIIVGQLAHLHKINFKDVEHKLSPRVTEENFKSALASVHPATADCVSLYINLATLASLPNKCSRHNCPARPHALSQIVRGTSSGSSETIVVVCPFADVLASASAIARSYPAYSKKTGGKQAEVTISVEFILVDGDSESTIDYDALNSIGAAVRTTARIVDTPCNEMNVDRFVKEIEAVSKERNLQLTVIRGEQLKEKGLNGIYSVGRAASVPPALVVLRYVPNNPSGPSIAWVGKGIVYDTGGLSLKTKTTMPGMKRDCGGAAAILGAMYVAAELGMSCELSAVFCLAENAVGPNATRPDDIETLYSGKTVEINNTDAEGRLVLADGVVYASRDLKADVILDMATLTGAQGIATGKYHGAVLTNNADWESAAVSSSRLSGDLLFPIPYAPELHFSEFNSAVADMKNSVGDRSNAQSSCAGLFILAHLGFDFSGTWIHVDMASPVHSGERATGYGVALLSVLFGDKSHSKMLNQLKKLSTSL
ncbi:Cytosol aminopeptidase family, catalytic domain [Nesidiocoris tenuis]|uniref:Cytosol aminopeptidase family, catalytic domain n=1 Tax=Nesidiocoris tenuis TaxID=355587 RepID=A0ABN7BDA7_9HEMI|nr:Cytosol aminopeptidase family, catalytic domain [Nesidiocoris tenuis]